MSGYEFTIAGEHPDDRPVPLRIFDATTHSALEQVFADRRMKELEDMRTLPLPPISVQIEPGDRPESDLVIGYFIDGAATTVFRKTPHTLGIGSDSAVLDDGNWVRGTHLYSPAYGGKLGGASSDLQGNSGLILESLSYIGEPMTSGVTVGVDIDEMALHSLMIAQRRVRPVNPATGQQAGVFDPNWYL